VLFECNVDQCRQPFGQVADRHEAVARLLSHTAGQHGTDGRHQVVLILEVIVQGTARNPCLLGDEVEAGARVALLVQTLDAGLRDQGAGLLGLRSLGHGLAGDTALRGCRRCFFLDRFDQQARRARMVFLRLRLSRQV
jgi:hypothetical protein